MFIFKIILTTTCSRAAWTRCWAKWAAAVASLAAATADAISAAVDPARWRGDIFPE